MEFKSPVEPLLNPNCSLFKVTRNESTDFHSGLTAFFNLSVWQPSFSVAHDKSIGGIRPSLHHAVQFTWAVGTSVSNRKTNKISFDFSIGSSESLVVLVPVGGPARLSKLVGGVLSEHRPCVGATARTRTI